LHVLLPWLSLVGILSVDADRSVAIVRTRASLRDRVKEAVLIALGTVGDKHEVVAERVRYGPPSATNYDFIIQQVWKGCAAPGDSLRFRLPGSRVSGRVGDAQFSKGQLLVCFLQEPAPGSWWDAWILPEGGYDVIENGRVLGGHAIGISLGKFSNRVRRLVRPALGDSASGPYEAGHLVGWIVDATEPGKAPIPFADVVCVGTNRKIRTDENGQFRLADLPAGCHEVRVEVLGDLRQTRRVFVHAGRTDTLGFVVDTSRYPPKE
jgi:hypothetical protein